MRDVAFFLHQAKALLEAGADPQNRGQAGAWSSGLAILASRLLGLEQARASPMEIAQATLCRALEFLVLGLLSVAGLTGEGGAKLRCVEVWRSLALLLC